MNIFFKIFVSLGLTLSSMAQNIIDINLSNTTTTKTVIFKAYPNPTTGLIHIENGNLNNEIYQYSLYDTRGKQILKGELVFRKKTINIENHPTGTYFLNINNTKFRSIKTFKIFKE